MGLSSLRRRHANCLVGRSAAGLGRAWAACTRKLPELDFSPPTARHLPPIPPSARSGAGGGGGVAGGRYKRHLAVRHSAQRLRQLERAAVTARRGDAVSSAATRIQASRVGRVSWAGGRA